jgi:hypothetical protein
MVTLMRRHRHRLFVLAETEFKKMFRVILALSLILAGCGGGGGGSQQSSPPDFSLSVSPKTITVSPGGGAPVSVSATPTNGFASPVSVQVSGLPAGISAAPASFTLTPGTPQSVTFSAAASASAGTTTAAFTGTSGTLSSAANVSVIVSQETVGALPSRTRYVRSDAVTEYGYSLNSHWAVYNAATSRFFVTDPSSNHVFVFDSATETMVGNIPVPGAYGIDQTPDGSTLYVGTMIGDIYTIDSSSLTVTQRYMASQIGPNGYQALISLVLSNGSLALLGSAGGIPSVDGSASFAVWNSTNNSIMIYASTYGAGQLNNVPVTSVCGPLGNIGGFTLTADRTTVIVGSIDSDGTLCEVNASTGQDNYVAGGASFINKIVTSPDGNYIALPIYPDQVELFNAHSLAKVSQFAVSGDTSSASSLVFSADSQTLFVPNDTTVYAYSISGQPTGWLPNITVEPESGGGNVAPAANPVYEVSDTTGLLAGPMEEGFGFLDTTAIKTGSLGSVFTNAYLSPATGPTSGGTQVQWEEPNTNLTFTPTIYFGGNQGSSASVSGETATVTTPPGAPGPVSVYLFAPDGGMQLIPDGFSYGPSVLEVTPNASTADGGGTGVIYGYGFGPTGSTTIPTDLGVRVVGETATIVAFQGSAYPNTAPPFPLQSISYTIPAASSGSSGSVSVTSSSGQVVAQTSLAYLPATQQYSLPGSQLVQGIYDPVRDLYYFTDTNQIQVFSLTQQQWLSPITVPAPNGATQRLWGIALSPDSTKLAITDAQANVIYLINPANTSSVQTFPGPTAQSGITLQPAGVAISNSGIAYFAIAVEGVSEGNGFYQLNTNTGTLTVLGASDPDLSSYGGTGDRYFKTAISSDNSHIFFNNDGYVFDIDTATGAVSPATVDQECCYGTYELALSSGQTQFAASNYLYDINLNAESSLTLNDREIIGISYVYGAKLSPDGTLFFQPSTNGIDVFDGRLGILLNRIALPFSLSANYDALVEDGQDNKLIAITGANGDGIAVVDLTSLKEPGPLPYAAATRALLRGSFESKPHTKTSGAASGTRAIPHVTHFILPARRGTASPARF